MISDMFSFPATLLYYFLFYHLQKKRKYLLFFRGREKTGRLMFPGAYTGEMEMAGRDFSYKESWFYRKLYPSFLFLCSAFAGTGILFVSPFLSVF